MKKKIIFTSLTTIIHLNIFNESHPDTTVRFSGKIGRLKSLLNAQGPFKIETVIWIWTKILKCWKLQDSLLFPKFIR